MSNYTIVTLIHLVRRTGSDEVAMFTSLFPLVLKKIEVLAASDQDEALTAIDTESLGSHSWTDARQTKLKKRIIVKHYLNKLPDDYYDEDSEDRGYLALASNPPRAWTSCIQPSAKVNPSIREPSTRPWSCPQRAEWKPSGPSTVTTSSKI